MEQLTVSSLRAWIELYKQKNACVIRRNPTFAAWLEKDYRPVAGGWQY